MKKQPDGEILFFSNIIRFNSPSSWSHWCRCTFRTLFKKVTFGSVHDWNWWWSHISNNKLMRSISFIVNENLEKPPLTLLQPKASPRTNATELLEIAYSGWRMVNAPEVRSVEWNTTLRKLWNQRKRDRFSVQFSKKEFDGWKEAERYKSFRTRTSADVIRFQEGRSTAEPVADDEMDQLKIDFRVQGIHQDPLDHREIRHIIHPVLCDYKGIAPKSSLWEDCCAARKPPSEDVLTERSQAQWHRESQQAFAWTEDICIHLHQIEKRYILHCTRKMSRNVIIQFSEPSYSPKTVSRKAMNIEYLVSSFFFVGMERIAILVEFSKVGYQWIYISYKEFRL